jgi:hypothetical protein
VNVNVICSFILNNNIQGGSFGFTQRFLRPVSAMEKKLMLFCLLQDLYHVCCMYLYILFQCTDKCLTSIGIVPRPLPQEIACARGSCGRVCRCPQYTWGRSYTTISKATICRAMAQAVSRRPLSTEARVRSQVKYVWDLWWTKWHWDWFFSDLSVFPCRFHSTGAPLIVKIGKKLFIHLSSSLGLHKKP